MAKLRFFHHGYGIYGVHSKDEQIGVCYEDPSRPGSWVGSVEYKGAKILITGIGGMESTMDSMGAAFVVLKEADRLSKEGSDHVVKE